MFIPSKNLTLLLLGLMTISLFLGCAPHRSGIIRDPSFVLPFNRAIPIYQNTTIPFSYPSPTRRDLSNFLKESKIFEVEGKSSAYVLFIPFSFQGGFDPTSGFKVEFNDRGINQAIADVKERYDFDYLMDIRIDFHLKTYFLFYNKLTTVVHAKGIKLKRSPKVISQDKKFNSLH